MSHVRRYLVLCFVLCMIAGAAACNNDKPNEPKGGGQPSQVEVKKEVTEGGQQVLTITINDAYCCDQATICDHIWLAVNNTLGTEPRNNVAFSTFVDWGEGLKFRGQAVYTTIAGNTLADIIRYCYDNANLPGDTEQRDVKVYITIIL